MKKLRIHTLVDNYKPILERLQRNAANPRERYKLSRVLIFLIITRGGDLKHALASQIRTK